MGENLRAFRQARNLSQEAFADFLGVHRTYMGGIERGERNLTLKSLERIAAELGLDPLKLLSLDPPMTVGDVEGIHQKSLLGREDRGV